MSVGRLARTCLNTLIVPCLLVLLAARPASSAEPDPVSAGTLAQVLSHGQTRRLISLAQPRLKDAAGWAEDILWALEISGLSRSAENVCALVATIDQESNFKANPPVEGLGRRAIAALKAKLDGTGLHALVLRTLFAADPSIKRRLLDRLRAARTERDIDVAYRKLIAETLTVQSIIELDRDYGLGAAEFLESRNEITTIGSMQVSVVSALEFERRYLGRPLYFEDIYRVRDFLYTRRGGILAGTRQLLGYRSGYTEKVHRFADYNAGRYSSRNAAFQWAVSRLDGRDLDLDGDLLIYRGQDVSAAKSRTEQAIIRIAEARGLPLNPRQVRQDLRMEKDFGFTATPTYTRVIGLFKNTYGEDPPFARIPEIRLQSVKLDRPLTTAWFARRVDGRYRRCLSRVG
ncbi:MAG: DUF1615 domain-containing protein [Alphaproteobacteria bacterium]|nr:DUF1615 domain-containing protein [Alphaproteobacteria bacterium]